MDEFQKILFIALSLLSLSISSDDCLKARLLVDSASAPLFQGRISQRLLRDYDAVDEYRKTQAFQDNVEVLFYNGFGKHGHIALRIGDTNYEIFDTGIEISPFGSNIYTVMRKYAVEGFSFKSTPAERKAIIEFFEQNQKSFKYSNFTNNCAQVVCRSLDVAEVARIRGLNALSPVNAIETLAKEERIAERVVYGKQHYDSTGQVTVDFQNGEAKKQAVLLQAGAAGGTLGSAALLYYLVSSFIPSNETSP